MSVVINEKCFADDSRQLQISYSANKYTSWERRKAALNERIIPWSKGCLSPVAFGGKKMKTMFWKWWTNSSWLSVFIIMEANEIRRSIFIRNIERRVLFLRKMVDSV